MEATAITRRQSEASERRSAIRGVVSDAASLSALGAGCLVGHTALRPYQRAFFCDDESLSYPLLDGTVPFGLCLGVGLPLATAIVAAGEALRLRYADRRRGASPSPSPSPPSASLLLFRRLLPSPAASACAGVAAGLFALGFGLLVCELFTVAGKLALGRQRPHFLAVCRLAAACRPGVAYNSSDCRPADAGAFANAQKSFPSGHSSFSVYLAVYAALHLRWALGFGHSLRSVVRLLQAALLLLAAGVCASRVSDYRHHATDVVAGAALGAVCAALAVAGRTRCRPRLSWSSDSASAVGECRDTEARSVASAVCVQLRE